VLTGELRRLAMASWEIERALVAPRRPPGTELDDWNGRVFVSLVGVEFRRMRPFGVPLPFYGDFAGVNFRFYARRREGNGWAHGAVFIRNFVGRRLVAAAARVLYGENVNAARVEEGGGVEDVAYRWRHGDGAAELRLEGAGDSMTPAEGSLERFLTDRPRGFVRRAVGPPLAYTIGHPVWRVRPTRPASLRGDVDRLYGEAFAEALSPPPVIAFLADGSAVTIAAPAPFETIRIESPA
jgi:uncharacterized protein